jgi:excisionase family DNA binding protein
MRIKPLENQAEWLDLAALTEYACISERTVRGWIHRSSNPLPAVRVGSKILVRRSIFDAWLENHRLKSVDVGCIVEEMVASVMGTD